MRSIAFVWRNIKDYMMFIYLFIYLNDLVDKDICH